MALSGGLWGCSSSSNSTTPGEMGTGSTAGSGAAGSDAGGDACKAGQACGCATGQVGTLDCSSGDPVCKCAPCPSLELHEVAPVSACGGDPFGAWRLVDLELGSSTLTLASFGQSLGDCTVTYDAPKLVPHAVMWLEDGGLAEYSTERTPVRSHWSESCVVSKVSSFSCGADAWTGVANCGLDCDVCSCDQFLSSGTDDRWVRTATTLTIAQFGKSATFDYCVEGDSLSLSSAEARLRYERVYPINAPTACDTRTPGECERGQGCRLGVCDGGVNCTQRSTESSCLTLQGCSWDATQCGGFPESCTLADFDVVPGCTLSKVPITCEGTPTTDCAVLTVTDCKSVPGCTVNDTPGCEGPVLQCAGTVCDQGWCTGNSLDCRGTTSCSAMKNKSQCDQANITFHDGPCTWQLSRCDGTPLPCSEYNPGYCSEVPGCTATMGTPP